MMEDRTRTFSWQDPSLTSEPSKRMSGLDFLQAMIRGEIPYPPMARLMNMHLAEAEKGRAIFTIQPAEYHYNPIGLVHGGLAFTLLDSAMGCAVHSILPLGSGYTTIELHVNLVRPITTQTGLLSSIGEVIHAGRRMATAQGRLIDSAGKLYAHGTTTCMIFSGQD